MDVLLMRSRVFAVLSLFFAAACGSSSNDDRPGSPELPADVEAVDNRGQTGLIYIEPPTGFAEIDVATGIAVHIRAYGSGRPSADGSEFVTIVSDDNAMLDEEAHSTELVIYGRDGRAVQRFGRPDFMYGPRLSHDRQRVAFEYHSIDAGDDGGVDILNITDRNGEVLARYIGASWWEWAADGSLFVAAGDTIYTVPAAFGDPTPLKQFPGDAPTDLSLSPDGSQLAFGLGERGLLENHVYVMNVDGTGVRQLTTSNLNEDSPAWSPDGSAIAVRQGITYVGTGGGCPEVFIVPADSDTIQVRNDGHRMQMLEDGSARGVCAFGPLSWRPNGPAYERNNGSAIAGDGSNRGLSGTLVYDDPSEVVSVELATGAFDVWTDLGGLPDVSRDGSELLIRAEDASSGDYDDVELLLLNRDGERILGLLATGTFLDSPRLSYDGQHMAVRYSGPDNGADWAISVFDRAGEGVARLPREFESFAWAPDGRMFAAAVNQLAVTDAALTVLSPVVTLTEPISDLAVSPDGTQLALTLTGHIWVMNVDGSSLRQLTMSSNVEYDAEWSPDGRHILVRHGETCGQLFVVPADATRVFVGNPAVPTTAVPIMHIEDGGERTTCAFSRANWR